MNKKVLVISASPRKFGNSSILCDEFIRGTEENGNQVEKLYVRDMKIAYCIGCDACQKNEGICIHKDDMNDVTDKMANTDVIVLATPVYFYSMDAQLKTLIDRLYARFMEISNKEFYYIITAAADEPHYLDATIAGLRGFLACLPDAKERGIVYGLNAHSLGAVKVTPAMNSAYELGKSV